MQITRRTLIGDIVQRSPNAIEVLQEHGLQCVGCHIATWETLEQAAQHHGIDVDELVKHLQKGEEGENDTDRRYST